MRIKYFKDTGTVHIEFTDREVVQTRAVGDNLYLDLDKTGNLVGMTIEHAPDIACFQEFSFQEVTE